MNEGDPYISYHEFLQVFRKEIKSLYYWPSFFQCKESIYVIPWALCVAHMIYNGQMFSAKVVTA